MSVVSNTKAKFDYTIVETFNAGMVLTGLQVKALRNPNSGSGQCSLFNNHVTVNASGADAHIAFGPDRVSVRLLLHKKELDALREWTSEKGRTLVLLDIHLHKGMFKATVATVKGKKMYDKRQTIKERDDVRRQD